MFYQFPPVGDRIITSQKSHSKIPPFFVLESMRFYQSGTAALSAALTATLTATLAASVGATKAFGSGDKAEVILPAYACPDLVSAAIYAGVKPVLVDLEEDRPWLDLGLLEAAITQNTVAIVAVNLFGIAERWEQLRLLAKKHELILIEDSAQYFPGKGVMPEQGGDLVVFSFGRGKPVSLLGGGAVLCRDASLFEYLVLPKPVAMSIRDKLSFILKASLYNVMISPYLYWLPQSLPFLHLGETRYHALSEIIAMDSQRLKLLANNIGRYQDDSGSAGCREIMDAVLDNVEAVIDLPKVCGMEGNRRLLRYPLLIDPTSRLKIHHALKKLGVGVSTMYPTSLVNLPGLEHIFEGKQKYPNAEKFAAMILTISVKACINRTDVKKLNNAFSP